MRRYGWYIVAGIALVLASNALVPLVRSQQPQLVLSSGTCPFGTALVTGTETSLITSPGVSTFGPRTIRVLGQALITVATQTTAVTLRIRRGSGIAGAQVITPTAVSATAQTAAGYTFAAEDAPGEVAGQQYSLTAQQTGATANGTAATCELWVWAY